MPSFELENGLPKPDAPPFEILPIPGPDEIHAGQEQLAAKRKLGQILCSKAPNNTRVDFYDMDEVYIKQSNHKCRSWTAPRTVPIVDRTFGVIIVPGGSVKHVTAAIEDVYPAVFRDDLSLQIQTSQDVLESRLNDPVDVPERENDAKVEQSREMDTTDDDSPNFKVRSLPNWMIKLMYIDLSRTATSPVLLPTSLTMSPVMFTMTIVR